MTKNIEHSEATLSMSVQSAKLICDEFFSYATRKHLRSRILKIDSNMTQNRESDVEEATAAEFDLIEVSNGYESIWLPPSVEEIKNNIEFSSSIYHSKIPKLIEQNPKDPIVLGVDEAGRGPVLGSMVYGVAYTKESYEAELKKYGFADSKTLKEEVRKNLFHLIETPGHELHYNVGWATTTMTARDISAGMLQSSHGKGSYNLNEQAHDTTIALIKDVLEKGVNITKIFVDTVGPPATYQSKLQKLFPKINVTVTKKADSIFPIVSTASVVAKVTRDTNLRYFSKSLLSLQDKSLGSGYPSDPNTSAWLKSSIDPVFGWHFGLVRFSWQTTKDCLAKNGGKDVLYEAQFVKPDKGYTDITTSFTRSPLNPASINDTGVNPSSLLDSSFYGSSEVVI